MRISFIRVVCVDDAPIFPPSRRNHDLGISSFIPNSYIVQRRGIPKVDIAVSVLSEILAEALSLCIRLIRPSGFVHFQLVHRLLHKAHLFSGLLLLRLSVLRRLPVCAGRLIAVLWANRLVKFFSLPVQSVILCLKLLHVHHGVGVIRRPVDLFLILFSQILSGLRVLLLRSRLVEPIRQVRDVRLHPGVVLPGIPGFVVVLVLVGADHGVHFVRKFC